MILQFLPAVFELQWRDQIEVDVVTYKSLRTQLSILGTWWLFCVLAVVR